MSNLAALTPISSDAEDFAVLTSGHFLVGKALTALPEPLFNEQLKSDTERYTLITKMHNYSWDRWRKEVLQKINI